MKAALLLFALLAGCSGGGLAGTYKSGTSLREIVLHGDGTFRMMIGERTSPMDVTGTFRQEGDTLVFTAASRNEVNPSPSPAKITDGGLAVGTETFHKT